MNTLIVPIGAEVKFRLAGRQLVGRVLQDRGPIGKDGRRLYAIRYELGAGNWYTTEVPVEELERISTVPGIALGHHGG